MTSEPDLPREELLSYRDVSGEDVELSAMITGATDPAPESLITRSVQLSDGRQARQLLVDRTRGRSGYQRLDNEILAGLRLARLARPRPYPPEVGRLIGYAPDSTSPYALLEPYRGESVSTIAGRLAPNGQHKFSVSLMTGLRWLAVAGIAHRRIGPSTVRWDGEHALITDFSLATLIGARQQVVTTSAWAAFRPQGGPVTEADDILAAGLLIYYVLTGEDLTDGEKLDDWPELRDQLDGVFLQDPALRPSARELLTKRLGAQDPVPRWPGGDPQLDSGRRDFDARRRAKHPELGAGEVTEPGAGPQPGEGSEDDRRPSGGRRRRRLLFAGLLMILTVASLMVWVR